jgi:diphosphomevalonate decarboxylase
MELVYAPSNIALIKYMGKSSVADNQPANESLSFTLSHLQTVVGLESSTDFQDEWVPLLELSGFSAPDLNEKSKSKFLQHLQFLKLQSNDKNFYKIYSANNFPSDCGLASSASSFAALTKAYFQLRQSNISTQEMAKLSQKGSGSSCRSFFSPWAVWKQSGAEEITFEQYPKLLHAAVIIHSGVKEVSSSQAHLRVISSPHFSGRVQRAQDRQEALIQALRNQDWSAAYDMHNLFETSVPGFRYRNEFSKNVMMAVEHIWNFKKDGPLATMDAGPNIHLLWRTDQLDLANKMVDHFKKLHVVMTSWRGLR